MLRSVDVYTTVHEALALRTTTTPLQLLQQLFSILITGFGELFPVSYVAPAATGQRVCWYPLLKMAGVIHTPY